MLAHGEPLRLRALEPSDGSGEQVTVRVLAAGVCHSDLHLWQGHYELGQGERLPVGEHGIVPPLVLGHEIAGEVLSGPGIAAGEAVLVYPWIGCGECPTCRSGEEQRCAWPRFLGMHRPGGFADQVVVPDARYLVPIGSLDPAAAAPLACAGLTVFRALKTLRTARPHSPVVVIGVGGLGLMAITLAGCLGVERVVAVDIDPLRRDAALACGAHAFIDASEPGASARIRAAAGAPVQAILDVVGLPHSVGTACRCAARGAHIVLCGLQGGQLAEPLPLFPLRELTLQGSFVGSLADLRELVQLVRTHGIVPTPLDRRPLTDANAALEALRAAKVVGRLILQP